MDSGQSDITPSVTIGDNLPIRAFSEALESAGLVRVVLDASIQRVEVLLTPDEADGIATALLVDARRVREAEEG